MTFGSKLNKTLPIAMNRIDGKLATPARMTSKTTRIMVTSLKEETHDASFGTLRSIASRYNASQNEGTV